MNMKRNCAISVGTLSLLLAASVSVFAADDAPDFETRVRGVIDGLDAAVATERYLPSIFQEMLRNEYGTAPSEFRWALDQSLSWGRIAVLSYIQVTTGRSFEELTAQQAHADILGFTLKSEMSPDKMIGSLEGFSKRLRKARNSMIFDRLRLARRVEALPDLGSGFGLFQEALDFRRIEAPRPIKIHTGGAGLAGGGKGN
jgi:hypothetical protein